MENLRVAALLDWELGLVVSLVMVFLRGFVAHGLLVLYVGFFLGIQWPLDVYFLDDLDHSVNWDLHSDFNKLLDWDFLDDL